MLPLQPSSCSSPSLQAREIVLRPRPRWGGERERGGAGRRPCTPSHTPVPKGKSLQRAVVNKPQARRSRSLVQGKPWDPGLPQWPKWKLLSKDKGGAISDLLSLGTPQKEKGFIGRPPTRVQEFPADEMGCKKKKNVSRKECRGKGFPQPSHLLPSSLSTPKREKKG